MKVFRKLTAFGAVVGAAVAASSLALAQIPATDGNIYACYSRSGGALRVVDGPTTKCKTGETSLSWTQHGLKGDTGAIGATGPAGPSGPSGSTGPAGPQGPQGPKGQDGAAGTNGAQGPEGPQGPVGPAGKDGFTPTFHSVSKLWTVDDDFEHGYEVFCPDGEFATGGGFDSHLTPMAGNAPIVIGRSVPLQFGTLSGWQVSARTVHPPNEEGNGQLTVYAVCATPPTVGS